MWYYGGRIRIEPDWNVKGILSTDSPVVGLIRIEPDWNVKVSSEELVAKVTELEQNQIGM